MKKSNKNNRSFILSFFTLLAFTVGNLLLLIVAFFNRLLRRNKDGHK